MSFKKFGQLLSTQKLQEILPKREKAVLKNKSSSTFRFVAFVKKRFFA